MAAGKRLGRTPKILEGELEVLRQLIREQPLATLAELQSGLLARCGVQVSRLTLSRAMRQAHIRRSVPPTVKGLALPEQTARRYGYQARHREGPDSGLYATSLIDAEWALVSEVFDWEGRPGKPPRHPRRAVVDACFYVVRTGCSWRLLPRSFPPWNAVYKLFRRWSREGRFEQMHDRLRQQWRLRAERSQNPSTAILDSQSTRSSPQGGNKGFDAGKRIMGRKRNLVVDTLGLLLAVVVTAASVQDRDGAYPVMAHACHKYPSIQRVFVDSAYAGGCAQRLQQTHGLEVQVVRHPGNRKLGAWQGPQLPLFEPPSRAFVPLPKRWIVERSHAWIERARRLVMHHDRLLEVSEAWVWLSETRRLLRRLTQP